MPGALQFPGEPGGKRSRNAHGPHGPVDPRRGHGPGRHDVPAVRPDIDLPGERAATARPGGALPPVTAVVAIPHVEPPDGVRTRSVDSSSAGLAAPRRAASTPSVWKPLASPVRSTPAEIPTPGNSRSRSGSSHACASISMTTRPAGPVATPTPRSGRDPHHCWIRSKSSVAA